MAKFPGPAGIFGLKHVEIVGILGDVIENRFKQINGNARISKEIVHVFDEYGLAGPVIYGQFFFDEPRRAEIFSRYSGRARLDIAI
jgi:hypothetical protein